MTAPPEAVRRGRKNSFPAACGSRTAPTHISLGRREWIVGSPEPIHMSALPEAAIEFLSGIPSAFGFDFKGKRRPNDASSGRHRRHKMPTHRGSRGPGTATPAARNAWPGRSQHRGRRKCNQLPRRPPQKLRAGERRPRKRGKRLPLPNGTVITSPTADSSAEPVLRPVWLGGETKLGRPL